MFPDEEEEEEEETDKTDVADNVKKLTALLHNYEHGDNIQFHTDRVFEDKEEESKEAAEPAEVFEEKDQFHNNVFWKSEPLYSLDSLLLEL